MNDSPPPHPPEQSGIVVHRLTIDYSVYYAVQEPQGCDESTPLLIAAHGFAQSCESFIENFTPLREKNVLVVAPQGPNESHWRRGRSEARFSWTSHYRRENSTADLMGYLTRLIDVLKQNYTFDHNRIVLLGFSQGAGLAFRFALNGPVQLAGVVVCGGHLPDDAAEKMATVQKKFPLLIIHGNSDDVITVDRARKGESLLREHGFEVETRYFDGGHEIPPEQVDAIGTWIASR